MNHTPSPTQLSLFDAQQQPAKAALPEGFRFAAREPTAGAAESVLSAVRKIKSAKSASESVLERYLALESEAVDTALLESSFITSSSKTPAFLLPRLLPRALARAHETGEVWTPELDRLSALARLAGYGENTVVRGIAKHMRSAVKPALAAVRDPAVFTRLVDETGSAWLLTEAMRSAVAAPVWSDESIQIVGERMPKGLGALAENPTLSQEHKQLVLELAVEALLQPYRDGRTRDYESLDYQYEAGRYSWRGRSDPDAIETLQAQGIDLTSKQLERLMSFRHQHQSANGTIREYAPHQVRRLLQRYIAESGDEDVALQFVRQMAATNPHGVQSMLWPHSGSYPGSRFRPTLELRREALRHAGSSPVLYKALAADDEARQDPEIRQRLLRSRATDVLIPLFRDGREEEFVKLFRALSSAAPDEAAEILQEHRETAERLLCRRDMLPLLKAESQQARLLATTIAPGLPQERKQTKKVAKRAPARARSGNS